MSRSEETKTVGGGYLTERRFHEFAKRVVSDALVRAALAEIGSTEPDAGVALGPNESTGFKQGVMLTDRWSVTLEARVILSPRKERG